MSPRARHDEGDILDATVRVIAEHGVSGATVDTVAARAGVSKATIYRHWGSRARLIHAALSSLEGPYVETEGDSLREDLTVLLWHLVEFFNRPDIGRVFASFIDAAARDPELAALHQQTMRRARASFEQVVRRGIERGRAPRRCRRRPLHRRRTLAVHLPPRRRAVNRPAGGHRARRRPRARRLQPSTQVRERTHACCT